MAANSLGGLIVRLGLDAAEFTTGLTKSEREAQLFAKRLDAGIKTAANLATIAIASMATAATAAFVAIDQLAKQAGNFQDLAEKTGANAEALASFSVAAQVAGTNMDTIAQASIKLTKNLTGVDDESKAAGAALTALGIPIKEFKALDPASQIEAVAKALAGFAEGAGKTAVAVALFGKSGADALPFLKELASEGGRQVILTQRQIELADEYADKQAKATAQLNLYAQVAATQALPAITSLTNVAKELIAELIGIDGAGKTLRDSRAIEDFANNAARALAFIADAGDSVGRIFRVVGNVIGATAAQLGALADGDLKRYNAIQKDASDTIDGIIAKQQVRFRLEKSIAEQDKNNALRSVEDRGFKPPGRTLNFAGAQKGLGGRGSAGAAARQTEAERFLESLQKQLEKTTELTVVEHALNEIQKGRLAGITPAIQAQILAVAAEIDVIKKLEEEIKAGTKAFEEQKRAMEDAQRVRERNTQNLLRESEAMAETNDRLRDEIAVILGGESSREALEKHRLAGVIAIKQEALALAELDGARTLEASILRNQINLLTERQQLMEGRSFAKQLAEDAKNLQEFKNLFADSFADAFSDFISGSKSAKDAFKAFTDDITRQLSRLASQQIANSLFGGNSGSGGLDWSKLIGSVIGLFSGGGSSSSTGFGMNVRAMGGPVAANTPYLVGERGEEVFVPRAAGTIVPNNRTGAGLTLVQNINVMPGADTRSAMQAANMAAQQARRAWSRNG